MDPGCCRIKLNSGLNVFLVEDRTHPHYTVIYNTLEHLTDKDKAYVNDKDKPQHAEAAERH
jgi:hypothetical protein